jgi:hypothetical protein
MEGVAMISRHAKDSFWEAIQDCLVEIYGLPRSKAVAKSSAFRKRVETASPQRHADIFYHAEPIDVAKDIAGEERDLTKYRQQYDEILARHKW